jgi:hypothetical protein
MVNLVLRMKLVVIAVAQFVKYIIMGLRWLILAQHIRM